jgi:hypothetical protein
MSGRYANSFTSTLAVTMGSDLKGRIEKAARRGGQSVNHFARGVLLAGVLAVEEEHNKKPDAT